MMRIWLSRSGPPIREQLSAQILLGIMSGQLPGGSKLPSVREFARRLKIHRNTVSAVYQELESRGWLESRAGSGVYVAAGREHRAGGVDAFVHLWVEQARVHGFRPEDLRAALGRLLAGPAAEPLAAADPDPELARILAAEAGEVLGAEPPWCGLEGAPPEAVLLVTEGNVGAVAARWPEARLRPLRLRALPDLVAGISRPREPVLIGLASRSPAVRQWAGALLSALGFPPDQVLLRDPAAAGWAEGLRACGIVAADVVAARELPPEGPRPLVFRIVAPESLAALRQPVTP
jgi:DNA-binding transcriptional regulator YhcF (GntR family)